MLAAALLFASQDRKTLQTDTIPAAKGNLQITFVGHGSLMFSYNSKVVHIDPFGEQTDYTKLPKADLILVTHEHRDHLDSAAIVSIRQPSTILISTPTVAEKLRGGLAMKNGESRVVEGMKIEAVPAYNLVHKRPDGQPFHPKGQGNGYVVTFGNKRVYIAGDTENIPEMKHLKNIDIAFLPVNLPYTMTPEMAADAARMVNPKILYPYHFGKTDTAQISASLAKVSGVEVRLRDMQ